LLAEETGFHALSSAVRDYESSRDLRPNPDQSSRPSKLKEKLTSLEEVIAFQSSELTSAIAALAQERAARESLERSVSQLSDRVSCPSSTFESERDYRRGCDYVFGSNGYDECCREKSDTFGLALLKRSAGAQ
jgi:uncharacterized coiled-coil protein SlyX